MFTTQGERVHVTAYVMSMYDTMSLDELFAALLLLSTNTEGREGFYVLLFVTICYYLQFYYSVYEGERVHVTALQTRFGGNAHGPAEAWSLRILYYVYIYMYR